MKFASLATLTFLTCSAFVGAAPVEGPTRTAALSRRELQALDDDKVQNVVREVMKGTSPEQLDKRFSLSTTEKTILEELYSYIKKYVSEYVESLESSSSKRDVEEVDRDKVQNVVRELLEGGDLEELHKRFTLTSTEKTIISEIWSYIKSFIISYIESKLGISTTTTTSTSTTSAAAKRDLTDEQREKMANVARALMSGSTPEELSKRFSISSSELTIIKEIWSYLKTYIVEFIDEKLGSSTTTTTTSSTTSSAAKREDVDTDVIQMAVRELMAGTSPEELHKRFTLTSTEKTIISEIWSYIKSFIVSYIESKLSKRDLEAVVAEKIAAN